MPRWLKLTALVALAGGATGGWLLATDRGRPTVADAPVADGFESLTPVVVEGIGYTEPRSEIRRLSFKTGGVISRCGPSPGDYIKAGEVIATLDSSVAEAGVAEARCRLEVARAAAADLKAGANPHRIQATERAVEKLREQARYLADEANRLRRLNSTQAISASAIEDALSKSRQAEIALLEQEAELEYLKHMVTGEQRALADARVRQAEAELRAAEQRLADTRLVAPFGGVVLKYLKREGEGISPLMPPEPVALFGDLSRIRVRAEVDERHARELAVGQPAEVYGKNVGPRAFTGQVVEVERVMGDKTVFIRSASERKDLHVLQVVIEMEDDFTAPVGLQVDVRVIHRLGNRRQP